MISHIMNVENFNIYDFKYFLKENRDILFFKI